MTETTQTVQLTADDRLEIQQIMAEYAIYEDSGQSEAWAALFSEDGGFVGGDGKVTAGRETLIQFSKDRWAKPESRQRVHWISNVVITPTAEGAEVYSYDMLVGITPDGYRILKVAAKGDTVVKENGRWRFQVRRSLSLGMPKIG